MSGRLCSIFVFCSIEKKVSTKEQKLFLGNHERSVVFYISKKRIFKGTVWRRANLRATFIGGTGIVADESWPGK